MSDNINFDYNNLSPFKWFVLENFPFIEADFDALTEWQLFCKLGKEINEIITSENTLGTQMENVTNAFIELQNYVNNYFDNLDLQEEVNTKLNKMAESGQLQEIINSYLQLKTAIIFPNVESMKASENLINGSFAKTLGYYNVDDGGKTLYRILDGNYVNNNMDVIQLNNGLFAIMVKSKELNIKQFGAKTDSDFDNTEIIQSAINYSLNVFIPIGEFKVNNTINIKNNTKLTGQDMNLSIITNTNTSDIPLFQYLSSVNSVAYDIKCDMLISNFKCNTRNFIKINDDTLTNANWVLQGTLLGLQFKNLWIKGIYGTFTDNNKDTNVIPTLTELQNYGIGFNLNSVFNSKIENCRIEGCGIAIYLKGCDLNTIIYNRLNTNANHIYTTRISSYGSQNLISHNDILENRRFGGITITTRFETITENYFENYTASACHIYGLGEHQLSIINNRFDNPSVPNIDIINVSPVISDIISFNKLNPSSVANTVYINVSHSNLDISNFENINSAIICYNNSKIKLRNNPCLLLETYNPYIISPYNIKFSNNNLTGSLFKTPYFILDTDNNLYYFNNLGSSDNSLIIKFNDLLKYYCKPFSKLRFTYKSTGSSQFYALIKGDTTQLFANMVTILNDNSLHTVDIDLSSNTSLFNQLYIELPLANYKLFGIELV